eukprot:scaffold7572_cov124-Isochrysis_galbana.AAC.8
MALMWLFQSRRPTPSDAPPLGVIGAVEALPEGVILTRGPKGDPQDFGKLARSEPIEMAEGEGGKRGATLVCQGIVECPVAFAR